METLALRHVLARASTVQTLREPVFAAWRLTNLATETSIDRCTLRQSGWSLYFVMEAIGVGDAQPADPLAGIRQHLTLLDSGSLPSVRAADAASLLAQRLGAQWTHALAGLTPRIKIVGTGRFRRQSCWVVLADVGAGRAASLTLTPGPGTTGASRPTDCSWIPAPARIIEPAKP